MMTTMRCFRLLFPTLALLVGADRQVGAQSASFVRMSGPTAVKLESYQSDGTLVWSNAKTGSRYTIQVASSLKTNWVDYVRITAATGANTNRLFNYNTPTMSFIPGGSFTMGDTLDGEADASPITITVSEFYMDVNLVTYSQWQMIYSYATGHGYTFMHSGAGKATNQPVQSIDWYDTVKWCNARSQQTGLTPVYYTDSGFTHVYTNGETDAIYANWTANGYRLPTEAEWEKAARGGLSGFRFPWGNLIDQTQANYYSDTSSDPDPASSEYDQGPGGYNAIGEIGGLPDTSPVGSFPPNNYGLFDMAGNVVEWCWDWYDTPYGQPTTNNPTGPVSGSARVLRGGGWDYYASAAKTASRLTDSPSAVWNDYGFRCARGLY